MSLITSPKLDKKLPQVLYYEDLEKLLNSIDDNTVIGLRNNLILIYNKDILNDIYGSDHCPIILEIEI